MESIIRDCLTGEETVVYISDEEYNAMRAEAEKQEKLMKYRPLNDYEVFRMFAEQQINSLIVDDNTALRMASYYPEWAINISYTPGFKVQYKEKLYRAIQAHTSLTGWEPENALSLWEQINGTHSGELEDPIPYDGNMTLESGKCYKQDYVIYLCNRDTSIPVYQPLKDLVGLYVEVIC